MSTNLAVALFCHGIWKDGIHHGLMFREEQPQIDLQAMESVQLANSLKAAALIVFGGEEPGPTCTDKA